MTRDEFKTVARNAIETVTATAEKRSQKRLPRLYVWGPADRRTRGNFEELVDLLTNSVFHSEDQISPCVEFALLDGPAEWTGISSYSATSLVTRPASMASTGRTRWVDTTPVKLARFD